MPGAIIPRVGAERSWLSSLRMVGWFGVLIWPYKGRGQGRAPRVRHETSAMLTWSVGGGDSATSGCG